MKRAKGPRLKALIGFGRVLCNSQTGFAGRVFLQIGHQDDTGTFKLFHGRLTLIVFFGKPRDLFAIEYTGF
jgi:hypothetical protein